VTIRALRFLAFFAILLPGAWYAWQWRSMPHAAEYHDDGLYYIGAKSMAETGSYRIESLPKQPAQTKYPPLWPATLAVAWAANPHYPDNLPVAMLLCWMWLPLTLAAYRKWLMNFGLSPNVVLGLGALWALNPYVVLFSTAMLSEMQFTFLLLASLALLERRRAGWIALAGAVAGLAFLSRTAGIALLPAAAGYLALRGRWRHAGVFAAAMAPAIVGWAWWSGANRAEGRDMVTLYYTNYFGYYLATFEWKELHLYLWKNVDGLLRGLGALLLPDTTQSLFDKMVAETLGVAGMIGLWRLWKENRTGPLVPYALFSIVYAVILVVWPFPPTERLVLPVVPLWLVGLYTELRRLGANIFAVFRKPEMSQRVAGGVITACLAGLLVYCGWRQFELMTVGLPRFYEEHAERLVKSEPVMAWIRANLPADAKILAEVDPLVYLRTGRRGAGVFQNTIHWYRENHGERTEGYLRGPEYAREQRIGYLLLNEWDYSRDMPAEEQARMLRGLRSDPRLELLFSSGPSAIYRVR
jgi:hypothetical protein